MQPFDSIRSSTVFFDAIFKETRKIILPYFNGGDMGLEHKHDDTPVTKADRETEAFLREFIDAKFPDHGILGEEMGTKTGSSPWSWILDPIDGTKSFVAGVPLFGTLVALLYEGKPVLSGIDFPALDWTFVGDGKTCLFQHEPIVAPQHEDLASSVLLCSDFLSPGEFQPDANFNALARQCRMLRSWGDCFGYALLIRGRAQVMVDPILASWDILPLLPVLRGAGCEVFNWQGGDPEGIEPYALIACSKGLRQPILQTLGSMV